MSNNRTAGVIESFELDRWGSWAGARGTVKDDRDGTIFNLFSRDFKGGQDHLPLVGKRVRFNATHGINGFQAADVELEQ
ncbi:hypothetical protein V0M98_22920 [Pseudomonas silesiensis]|uniref:hypothetical protein n=1 Tax=Pseudomonas silesiensis TaxID=1853130 RepID=UPI0030D398EB